MVEAVTVHPRLAVVLFDIHGVFFLKSGPRLHAVAERVGVRADALTQAMGSLWVTYRCGNLTEVEFWTAVIAKLPSTFRGTAGGLAAHMDHVDLVDEDLAAWARGLKNRYRLAALSNAGADLERRLDRFGLANVFEVVLNSHRVGLAKPDRAIYQLAIDRLGVRPWQILFVDDKERNTAVAREMGFRTHTYRDLQGLQTVLAKIENGARD